MIAEIRVVRPDILLVSVSSPRKQHRPADNLDDLGVPFAMGVGGTFDVVAGHTRRAPPRMQRARLEGFCRFARGPSRTQ